MIRITGGKGFQMTFENGVTISVQFGWGNYHDNREMFPGPDYAETDRRIGEAGSPNAEIAIWNAEDVWFNFGGDTVAGWVEPDDIAKWIAFAQGLPAGCDPNDHDAWDV
jgi:hypothetical protein